MRTTVPTTVPLLPPGPGLARHAALAVVLLAIALRVALLLYYGGLLAKDPDGYRTIARNLVSGQGYGYPPGNLNGSPTAYRPPLYVMLLSAIEWASRGNEFAFRLSLGIVQVALGALTVYFTIRLGRRLGLGRAAEGAGLLVAIDPLALYSGVQVMTETLATLLAVLLLMTLAAERTHRSRIAAGFVFGLATLCRPTFWAFGALAAIVWLVAACRRARGSGSLLHSAALHGLLILVGMALALTPWAARNAQTMGQPVLTTTHGGYTLLLAHNPVYTQRVVEQPWGALLEGEAFDEWTRWLEDELRRRDPALIEGPPTPSFEIARDHLQNAMAWQYIRENPLRAARAGLTLLGRFWNIVPMQPAGRQLPAAVTWGLGLYDVTLFATALAGLWRLRRDEWPRWWPCAVLLVSFTAVHSLYWADMRMRAPLAAAIALLAIRGVCRRVT